MKKTIEWSKQCKYDEMKVATPMYQTDHSKKVPHGVEKYVKHYGMKVEIPFSQSYHC